LRALLEIREDPLDGSRARVSPPSQIENKSRIANGFPAEASGRRVILTQKPFHFS